MKLFSWTFKIPFSMKILQIIIEKGLNLILCLACAGPDTIRDDDTG